MPKELHHPYFFTPQQSRPDQPILVFLPGMDETGKELMRLQTVGLEAAFDVRCFVIPADTLDSWEQLVQQLVVLTQAELEVSPRSSAFLCGESFGGCLALLVLMQAPKLFDHVILINPASSFPRVPLLSLGSFLLPWTPQLLYDASSVLAVPFLTQVNRVSPSARQVLLKAAQAAPKQTAAQRLKLMREFRVDPLRLRQISQPVLGIAGAKDSLLPSVAEVQRLATMFPNAKTVTLPDSGHACLIETDVDLLRILQTAHFI